LRARSVKRDSDVHNAELPVAPNPPTTALPSQPAAAGVAATPPPQPTADTSTSEPGATATFHLNVNAVLVPVVVRDRHGNFVDDLQKQDFEVLDDGKPRPVSGFLIEKHELPRTEPNSPAEAAASPVVVGPEMSLPSRITVFLFDDLNMGFERCA
jgi:hypothetical protein